MRMMTPAELVAQVNAAIVLVTALLAGVVGWVAGRKLGAARRQVAAVDASPAPRVEPSVTLPAAEPAAGQHPHVDALTGLANRLLLGDRLAIAVATADRSSSGVAVLCVDLDRFASINDAHGRPVGDRLLIEVAKRLRGATRDTDTVARLEADAFAVVQPFSLQPQSAQALSQRLVRILAEPHVIDGQVVVAPASIGVAFCPTDATNGEMLLKCAELAVRRVKRDDGNGVRFHDNGLDAQLRTRVTLTQGLRGALERGEMSMRYQPVLDGDRLDVVGFEALLRWEHPTRGTLTPQDFVPLAEESGLMPALGAWALDAACADAAAWPSSRVLCVNLSRTQLRQRDLASRISDALSRAAIAPERLELEVAESVVAEDEDRVLDVLHKLKARGMRVTLDQFGTGRASLMTLRRFAFDHVKLDSSLVAPLDGNEDAALTARVVLAMARTLDMEVSAVGVETDAQLQAVRALRCDRVQGYLLGRPALARDLSHAPRLSVVAA